MKKKYEYIEGDKARGNFERLGRAVFRAPKPRQKGRVSALFIFGRFTHDSQRVLTAVCEFALVHVEQLLNIVLCRFYRHQAGGKLHVAVLADAEQGMASHDPKFSLFHAPSLRRPPRHSSPVEIKLHHYRQFSSCTSR
jgi:hypothetical protein